MGIIKMKETQVKVLLDKKDSEAGSFGLLIGVLSLGAGLIIGWLIWGYY